MSKRKRLVAETERLRDLLFLTQGLRGDDLEFLRNAQAAVTRLPEDAHLAFIKGMQGLVRKIKREVGCKLRDNEIAQVVRALVSKGDGYVYVPKWFLRRRWFTKYERVFPRWPHVPEHALVMFDSDLSQPSPYALFLAEWALLSDVLMLWKAIEEISGDGLTFRTRDKEKQLRLASLLRTATAVLFHFVEAYLNGLAYDCFQRFHNRLDLADHDLLAEWDSKTKRQKFVSFDRKLHKYPMIVGKYNKKAVNVSNEASTKSLGGEGKRLRDALTHPSPFVNFKEKDPGKLAMVLRVSRADVKRLIHAATDYMQAVEQALGRNVALSAPWLAEARRGLT